MVDDGSGKLTVWRIADMKKAEVPKEMYGQFYQGDSYVMLYSYKTGRKDAHLIYIWQGRDSSIDEKGASALLAKDLDDSMGGDPVQCRVPQGREPNHFLTLFHGKMIVHAGGFASAFKNKQDKDTTVQAGPALYHIKGTTELNTRAVTVPADATNLNGADCFALVTGDTCYTWCGKGSSAAEKKVAENISKILAKGKKAVTLQEGTEPEAFWKALGGKQEYPSSGEAAEEAKEARLFHCCNTHGYFKVDEIFNFQQEDLINDDTMILDTYNEVFVWLGHDSAKEEKEEAMKTAVQYVLNAPDGRSKDTPVYRINSGSEPPNFTCHFAGWNPEKASDFSDPYEAKKKGLGGKPSDSKTAAAPAKKGPVVLEKVSVGDLGFLDYNTNFYALDVLQKGVPDKCNPAVREMYLSDADFEKIFKTKKADWEKLPKWKKDAAKKTNKLF